ncbi:MAG TPA: efflux RND transporter periplasmic adaptor subunit [Planktothrix sp.]|jgi:HlyD family secretion protein
MKPEVVETSSGKAVHVAVENEHVAELATRQLESSRDELTRQTRNAVAATTSRRVRTVALWAVVPTLLLSASVYAYQSTQSKPAPGNAAAKSAPPVVTVSTAVSKIQPVDDVLSATGSINAWDPLQLGAEISGLRILEVKAEEGDYVKKGQPLVVLNSALLRAQLEQAKARLHASQSGLAKTVQPDREEEVLALKAALEQAKATTAQEKALNVQAQETLANAKLNADRYRALAAQGATSVQDAETKKLTFDQAEQQMLSSNERVKAAQDAQQQAEEKLLEATNGGRHEDVDMSQATIEETQGQIKQLQEQIAETIIRAPDNGVVSQRNAHIGEITSAGKTLFSIIRLNKMEMRAQVSDVDLAKFQPGQSVAISSTEDDAKTIQGKVWLVSPQVDPTTRLGTVRIQLPANSGLKPGMFARAEVRLGHRLAVTVPVVSVVTRNGESFVFTLDGDRVVSNAVKVGVQDDKIAEITSGLKENQTIVKNGARFLSDHDVVRVAQ